MNAASPVRASGLRRGAWFAPPGAIMLVTFGLIALAVGAFWPSVTALAELWSHPERRTYQHGYLIAILALWLVSRERDRLAAASGGFSYPALALAVLLSIAWAIAWNAGLQVLHLLLWPAALWAALVGVLGGRTGRVLLLPVGFIYFAMPIWDALVPALQTATVLANRAMGLIANVPMLIQDRFVHIPEGSFEIAGGCSGLNYLIVGLAIATLLGEVNRHGIRRRLVLVLLGGAMAIVSNWLRVFIIIFAGHVSDMTHYLVRVDHYNFGWVLYAFVLAGFFLIARRLPEDAPAELPGTSPAPGYRAAGAATVAVAAVALAFGPLLVQASAIVADGGNLRHAIGISALDFDAQDGWQALPAGGEWVPVFPGADAESLIEFASGEDVLTVYSATYLRQAQGRELVGHESLVQGSGQGRFVSRNRRAAGPELPVAVIEAEWRDAGGARALIWWAYQVGDRRFTNPLAAQLWYGVTALTGSPVSSIVALRASCAGDCDHARSVLGRFASVGLPQLLSASATSAE